MFLSLHHYTKEAPTDLFKPGQAAAVRRGLLFKRKEKLEARKVKAEEEVHQVDCVCV